MLRGGRGGEGRHGGERQWEIYIPVIRMRDMDLYAPYEGRYGVGGTYERPKEYHSEEEEEA